MEKLILLINLGATLAMTGIIWLVQVVHYPLFSYVGSEKYREFHAAHMNLITFVVAPTMIVELITAGLLIFYPPPDAEKWILWTGAGLVIVVWASTFFLQVPLHEKLAQGYNAETHNALVNTNWIRTVAWTIRAALVLWLAWNALRNS